MNKLNNVNVNYLKIPKKHCGPQKTPSWTTFGPRVWDPWSNTRKQDKARSHITLQQVG